MWGILNYKIFINMNLQESIRKVLREDDYSPAGKEITPNKIVVHKSNPMFRDNILKDGLKAKSGECYRIYVGYGTKCKPAIFATNSTNKRAWFDSTYDDDIWEINTEMIPDVMWYKDKHYESRSKHIVTFQDIPSEALTLKYKGKAGGIMESIDKSEDKKLKLVTKMIHEFFDEVSFIEIKKYKNKPLISVYFDNDGEAANEDTYFAKQIQDKIYEYSGIKLLPYWKIEQYNTDSDFRLDAIKLKYDNEGNVISESEEKQPKYLNLIKDIVEPYKEDDCICDIKVSFEDDMYDIYLELGMEELNGKTDGQGGYVRNLRNDIKNDIKRYIPINNLYVGSYGTKRCGREPINESKNKSNKNIIKELLNNVVLPEYEHVICGFEVKEPHERFDTRGNTPFQFISVTVTFIGGPGTKLWPHTQGVQRMYDEVLDEVWDVIYNYTNEGVDMYSTTKKDCGKKNIQETIRKILKEETNPKKEGLLKIIKDHGLYDFTKDTGLNYNDIYHKVGEIPREVKIQYLKDAVVDLQQTPHELDLSFITGSIPLYDNDDWQTVYVEYLTNEDNVLRVHLATFDDEGGVDDFNTIREDDIDHETLDILVTELSEKLQHNRN